MIQYTFGNSRGSRGPARPAGSFTAELLEAGSASCPSKRQAPQDQPGRLHEGRGLPRTRGEPLLTGRSSVDRCGHASIVRSMAAAARVDPCAPPRWLVQLADGDT